MNHKLSLYLEKRDFNKTAEPYAAESGAKESDIALRYVIQHHLASRDHYDFRLEWRGVLLSWAVPKGPSMDPSDKRLAVMVEDHPLSYRDFEGTIPKGQYGGGTVMLWDEGFWLPLNDTEKGLKDGSLKFFIAGQRLKGGFALARMKDKDGKPDKNWLLIKEKDKYAENGSGIAGFTDSVRTGRTMEEIAGQKSPNA